MGHEPRFSLRAKTAVSVVKPETLASDDLRESSTVPGCSRIRREAGARLGP
jgi:hypothetical protein